MKRKKKNNIVKEEEAGKIERQLALNRFFLSQQFYQGRLFNIKK